jgi:hypothetical protein
MIGAPELATLLRPWLPKRVESCVAFSVGWGTNDQSWTHGLRQIQNYWYHWYMALDRAALIS